MNLSCCNYCGKTYALDERHQRIGCCRKCKSWREDGMNESKQPLGWGFWITMALIGIAAGILLGDIG